MSDDDAWTELTSQIPQLELLEVVIPKNPMHTVQGFRMFTPSVEFWNLWTTIRITWPIHTPSLSIVGGLSVLDQDGVDYGVANTGEGGDGVVWHRFLTTVLPVPLDVPALTVEEPFGTYTIDLSR